MSTTTINPSENNKGNKSNMAGQAAMAAAGAGLGVAGAMAADMINKDEEIPTDSTTTNPTEQTPHAEQPSHHAPHAEQPSHHAPHAEQPSHHAPHAEQPSHHAPHAEQPTAEQPVVEEPVVESPATPNQPTSPASPSSQPNSPTAQSPEPTQPGGETPVEQPLNPDDVAEAIIAEEMIDPDDIDTGAILEYESLGTISTIEGEEYMAAAYVDNQGNHFTMVDVDGDNVFDVLVDETGQELRYDTGELVTTNVTLDDIEEHVSEEQTYLAANTEEMDHLDDVDLSSMTEDMIS